jgi:hypothetical protein
MPINSPAQSANQRKITLALAWGVTLLVSGLPAILFNELGHGEPAWLFWAKIGFLACMIVASTLSDTIRPLRSYFGVILVLYLAEWGLQTWLAESSLWKSWFNNAVFIPNMLGIQLLRLAAALLMVIIMLLIKKRRSEFFLVRGDLNATAEPIPFLMTRPEAWSKLGRNLTIFISLGTLAFLLLAGRPSLSALTGALPFLPFVLLLAAMNAFSEEMNYKASFLSVLQGVVGRQQSLLLMAVFFGIGHFYGVPYGLVGVLMAGVLGWLLGKSMLETRGFAWPWFIHFVQDVLIFSFMAIGSVVAGGG